MGLDCAVKTCPLGPAWFDEPTGPLVAHKDAECRYVGRKSRSREVNYGLVYISISLFLYRYIEDIYTYIRTRILVQCVFFHVECYIRLLALVFFYRTL